MYRYLPALIIGSCLAMCAWAQDETAGDPASETTTAQTGEESEADRAEETPEPDDSDLDEQIYQDTDDDFRPSEEIPADQSIAFPTDI